MSRETPTAYASHTVNNHNDTQSTDWHISVEPTRYVIFRGSRYLPLHPSISDLIIKKRMPLLDGSYLQFDDAFLPMIPHLIRMGEVSPSAVMRFGYARNVYGTNLSPAFNDVFSAAEDISRVTTPPRPSAPLEKRLSWTVSKPKERETLAEDKRQETTDLVRGSLIPKYDKFGIDLLTQVRLIHRAHMKGNEHLILNPQQAGGLLIHETYGVDRLAGKIRTPDELQVNVGMASMLALCASYYNTPILMNQLTNMAEKLFPKDDINPTVTKDTIYHYVSAFQLFLALIHPFYEGNGRTSEDAMYALWQRRPDLKETIRYISADGKREGEEVEKRMEMINSVAKHLVRSIGYSLGVPEGELENCSTYYDVLDIVKKRNTADRITPTLQYLELFDHTISRLIARMETFSTLSDIGSIRHLADQLKNASPTYKMKNGITLGTTS